MLILRFVNVGNSRISARDSIVVLTLIAWAAIVTSVHKGFLRTFIQGRGTTVPRFII